MWWFAALLFLLGFSTLDIIVKSTGGPATPPLPPAPSSSKQYLHSVDGAQCGSARLGYGPRSSLKRQIARFLNNQKDAKAYPMSKVKYISSPNEIPAGQKYVLVVYGEEYAQTRHPLGLTITVASTVSQLSFLTAIHTAKGIAKHAGISEVFVCTAMTRGPNPTPSGHVHLRSRP